MLKKEARSAKPMLPCQRNPKTCAGLALRRRKRSPRTQDSEAVDELATAVHDLAQGSLAVVEGVGELRRRNHIGGHQIGPPPTKGSDQYNQDRSPLLLEAVVPAAHLRLGGRTAPPRPGPVGELRINPPTVRDWPDEGAGRRRRAFGGLNDSRASGRPVARANHHDGLGVGVIGGLTTTPGQHRRTATGSGHCLAAAPR